MDQDAFRMLLSSQRSQPNARQVTNTVQQKAAASASSEPAFKPRKVKKKEGKYRDRAAERREGTGNDYAQVEAVLEDFEKRVAHEDKDVIEQQRKYLGGDGQHAILVKGVDMSLLEQNRARAAATEDDEDLEQAFAEATSISEPTEPQKRTRQDIIRDLKAKRQNGDKPAVEPVDEQSVDNGSAFEAAKQAGKFKPIGFKPIGQPEEKSKKRKAKEGKEGVKKKKKQKVENTSAQPETHSKPNEELPSVSQAPATIESSSSKTTKSIPKPEPEPASLDEDFEIFAGAGEYEGFAGDEDSEEEHRDTEKIRATSTSQEAVLPTPVVGARGWFDEPEPEVTDPLIPEKSPPIAEAMATDDEPQEVRLRPLESSALPSIRDFLAMDEAAEKAGKRKARKEKKKKKKDKAGADDDD